MIDVWRPGARLTWRRLQGLLRHLPVESSLRAVLPLPDPDELGDDTDEDAAYRARWSQTDYMLAEVIDVLALANWQRIGDPKASRPDAYPRPTTTAGSQRRGLTAAQVAMLRARAGRA